MSAILSQEAVDAVAAAIFSKPGVRVVEAYSDFDAKPREFSSAEEVSAYSKDCAKRPDGLLYLYVYYADMGGKLVRETIRLKPDAIPGRKLRYTWNGWGLISIQLHLSGASNQVSGVTANSEARSLKWAGTYPENDAPSTWNWSAVKSHLRRLQRVLKRVA
jgi:hypothetical protein